MRRILIQIQMENIFLYPHQAENILVSRGYFGVESTGFLSADKFTKNLSTGKMNW